MEDLGSPTFLGLKESKSGPYDVVILSIPLEVTSSWKGGSANGPKACIEVSNQVELFDTMIDDNLPCGLSFHTSDAWQSDLGTLRKQLDSIQDFVKPWINGKQFPMVLGGEHGILLPIIETLTHNPNVDDLRDLTLVQIDAHADLRDELNGEKFSHGTVIRRCLDEGVGKVIQIGIRAYSKEESELIKEDDRIETWFARNIIGANNRKENWTKMLKRIEQIKGPVWLTFDIDGLNSSLVPSTGTPVPGGLSYWEAVELIEKLFSIENLNVIGADVNEIAPGKSDSLTEFNAALIVTKILSGHVYSIQRQKD
jgi:agmatinase